MSDSIMHSSNAAALQRRNRELSILNAIARALNSTTDLDQALHATLTKVAALFNLHTGWVWLLHEESGKPYLAAAEHLPPALAEHPELMEGSCYCLDTYREGDLEGAANVSVIRCTRLKGLMSGTDGLLYHASVPLYAHEKQLGVLNVASGDWRGLSEDDLRLLYTIGDLLGIAVERARLFARSIQLGAAEERNRLAREIHDTLAQGLTGITLQIESADALLEAGGDPGRVRDTLNHALALTRASLEEARRSVLDLRAAPLEGRPLAEALARLAQEREANDLQIDFEATGGSTPLPARIETGLYRIVQEALTNCVRHAAAGHIRMRLVTTPSQVQIMIEDDGQGFDADLIVRGRYGLVGMNERARLLGGSLRVESCPGAGTRLEVTVPLGAQHKEQA